MNTVLLQGIKHDLRPKHIHKLKVWILMKLLLLWLGLSQFVFYLPMILTMVLSFIKWMSRVPS
jgi:hypothetical protein